MIRIYPSEPGFAELERLVNDIHQLKNPELWWDVAQMSDDARQEQLEKTLKMMEEQIS